MTNGKKSFHTEGKVSKDDRAEVITILDVDLRRELHRYYIKDGRSKESIHEMHKDFDKAIRMLKEECDGCVHLVGDPDDMPCCHCRRNEEIIDCYQKEGD
jgi:hypothetical protein